MAATTWIAGSGDWNTAANWSNGVPGPADDATFSDDPTIPHTDYTVTGGGSVASLDVTPLNVSSQPTFTGTYTAGTFLDQQVFATLGATAVLNFRSGTVSGGAVLTVLAGGSLSAGPLTLANGTLTGTLGTFANPLTLTQTDTIAATGTLAGPIGGDGVLHITGTVMLADPANSFSGGLVIGPNNPQYVTPAGTVELAASGAAGSGPVLLGAGTLTLDHGVAIGPVTAATAGSAVINATDQATTVFAGQFPFVYDNATGHPTIVGATASGPELTGEGPQQFGLMTVQGGAGSVTVFAGANGGVFAGGSAGSNLIVAGPDLSAYTIGLYETAPGILANPPGAATIFGGGSNDLLVSSGTENPLGRIPQTNVLVAGAGNETLTGAGSTADAEFFGGSASDVIAAGGGQSVVVAGSGPATISGGSGAAAIFSGPGDDLVLGGAGADYVQVGTGRATLIAGGGMDLIGVVNGQAGGNLVVSGFRPGIDRIDAQGYAAAPAVSSSGGNTVLSFTDRTTVILLGVTSLPT